MALVSLNDVLFVTCANICLRIDYGDGRIVSIGKTVRVH